MNKLKSICVVADDESQMAYLCSAAHELAENVELMSYSATAPTAGAKTVYHMENSGDISFVSYLPVIADLVKERGADAVITSTTKNGRLAASVIAVKLNAAILTDISAIGIEDDELVSSRMVYGGTAFKTEKAKKAVICLAPGLFEDNALPSAAAIVSLQADCSVKFVGRRAKEQKKNNLATAKKVVGAGRGVQSEEALALVSKLAALLDAELGCTRPIAEEQKWMGRESYIGVSGLMLKPEFYLAVGVSGQIQHMVGVNQSNVLFAINKDKAAPIFQQCDYGIVGDTVQVISAIINELS